MTKAKVLETLNQFPMEFNTEELIDRLIFIDKVEKGLEEQRLNQSMSLDAVKELVNTWSK